MIAPNPLQNDKPKIHLDPPTSRWKGKVAAHLALPLNICCGSITNGFGILMYHRVTEIIRDVPEPTWNVTPDRFRSQLQGLLKRGYEAWPLSRVLQHVESGATVPVNVFVVTFDDGYANNYTAALPILRELEVPATIFIATKYIDSRVPFPSDDWEAAGSAAVPREAWRPLTTNECLELAEEPLIELGCHTHTHADFRGRPDDLYGDLLINKEELSSRFGVEHPTFAFPYGTKSLNFSGPVFSEVARRAGMRCALTTEDELIQPGHDPFDWGRFTAEQCDTGATLAAKLSGWYSLLKDGWHWVKSAAHVEQEAAVLSGEES
ncbi:polysaccharide deacetylase family protein [Calycomorphotria hydatis]|uniref:Poly-beta-1,6-N-acetyl-D-glucosamine N-deacetylase n=1 Tax=Calycomorphotria hydatis TaxID=2528027 RepID=A0A517TCS9_9PLAN|nr:polysaccharide deacetylase family protein [Calycomorphotria hydatis]QDT66172.1 Poly-beta-1,6-N-acetyl-D-glucosamine N-deacetylase precursor [Calycomorphotria hydatis]